MNQSPKRQAMDFFNRIRTYLPLGRVIRVAGSAIRSRFAGHASRSAKTRHALRLKPDHPIGAGQRGEAKPDT